MASCVRADTAAKPSLRGGGLVLVLVARSGPGGGSRISASLPRETTRDTGSGTYRFTNTGAVLHPGMGSGPGRGPQVPRSAPKQHQKPANPPTQSHNHHKYQCFTATKYSVNPLNTAQNSIETPGFRAKTEPSKNSQHSNKSQPKCSQVIANKETLT